MSETDLGQKLWNFLGSFCLIPSISKAKEIPNTSIDWGDGAKQFNKYLDFNNLAHVKDCITSQTLESDYTPPASFIAPHWFFPPHWFLWHLVFITVITQNSALQRYDVISRISYWNCELPPANSLLGVQHMPLFPQKFKISHSTSLSFLQHMRIPHYTVWVLGPDSKTLFSVNVYLFLFFCTTALKSNLVFFFFNEIVF